MTAIHQFYSKHRHVTEPVAIMAMALFAGSTRVIKYFPDSSLLGLTVTGMIYAVISLTNTPAEPKDRFTPLKKRDIAKATFYAGLKVAAVILYIGLIEKALKGRTPISYKDAAKLGASSLLFTAIPKYKKFLNLEEFLPMRNYDRYRNNPKEWNQLSREKRTQLIKTFIGFKDLSLQAFCPEVAFNYDELFPNMIPVERLKDISRAELSWRAQHLSMFDMKPETKFAYFDACRDRCSNVVPLYEMNDDDVAYLQADADKNEKLYIYCQMFPEYYYANDTEKLDQVFAERLAALGRGEINFQLERISTRSGEYIRSIPLTVLIAWENKVRDWNDVSEYPRKVYLERRGIDAFHAG